MRTNKQIRVYIAELVSIKTEIDDLNARKRIVGMKLGYGTWRSSEFPFLKVAIARGSSGWRVQWKAVAKDLAERLGLTDRELTQATYGNRSHHHQSPPTVSVQKDAVKRANPKLKVA